MSVTLLDLAALSTAIYEDPKDSSIINPIAGKWTKHVERYYPDTIKVEILNALAIAGANETKNPAVQKMASKQVSMHTGLRTALYVNHFEKKSVLVIRGTVADSLVSADIGTIISDLEYVFDNRSAMLDQVLSFFMIVKNSTITQQFPLVAITGHSLGGIMAKMLSPISKIPTYAFNSPGVLEYLKNKKGGYPTHTTQEVITYCAQGDPIGNLRHDNDVGIKGKNYVFLPIGSKIPENVDRINSLEYGAAFFTRLFNYHSMKLMFKTLLCSTIYKKISD